MYSTTLRLEDDLAGFLQDEAQHLSISVNALLADLVRQARETRARQRLAKDWAAYARDDEAQSVAYAFAAQSQAVEAAEPKAKPYRASTKPRTTPKKRP